MKMKQVCQYCGDIDESDNMTFMNTNDSPFIYCKQCWHNRNEHLRCEKCNKNYQAYTCTKDNDHLYICKDCQCDGLQCEYCPGNINTSLL